MFKKQKEDLKQMIDEVKVVPLVIITSVSLVIGFALGASTTAAMYKAVQVSK